MRTRDLVEEERGEKMNQEDVIVQCPRCGAKNRIPAEKKGRNARCGKCHTPLVIGSFTGAPVRPVKVTDASFQQEVLGSTGTVLVDFWASWCGPCRMISPIVEEIAGEVTDTKVGKVNIDEQPELASAFGIMSIPTLVAIKDGKVVNKMVGVRPKASILQMLAS